jgi:glycosyltransferase involved in cell wall biosynthesis
MRVLHINSGNMYGGVETFLATLAREAPAAPGMESRFALCFEGRLSAELQALRHTPHLLGRASLSRPHTVLRARRELRNLLRREPCDVVVCHQPWTCVLFAPAIRAVGLPVVLWMHMASRGRHWLERLCRLTRPDLVICNSRFTSAAVSQWLAGMPIEHVYCPVSPSRSSSAAARLRLRGEFSTSESDVVIVQVSRLEPWKGQRILLAALAELRNKPGWTCWMVGGSQHPAQTRYLHDLQSTATADGIGDRVRFLGDRSDVPEVLSAADVFCQPNTSPEPFGLSLVEALREGLPVVTSGVGGACEIVDESCGISTPPADVHTVSVALSRLMGDSELRGLLGAQARRRFEVLCDAPRQMRRIQAVLSSFVGPLVANGSLLEPGLK